MRRIKAIIGRGGTRPKTPSNLSGSDRSESTSTLPNPQLHSETEHLEPSPSDSPPMVHPNNQNSTCTADGSSLIIGTLWGKAAKSLDKGDLEKLNRLIKSKQEGEEAGPSKGHEGCLLSDGHDNDPTAEVSLVLSRLQRLKDKDEDATWRPVS
jgi:hypothetical protein